MAAHHRADDHFILVIRRWYPEDLLQGLAAAANDKDENMIRIGIVDDQVLIREGVKKVLQRISDMKVIAETDNISQLFRLIANSDIHVLVLDISIPGHGGPDVLSEVRRRWPQLPILVLSMHPEKTFALRALKAGVSGYITKSCSAEELVRAIRKVVSGGRYISPAAAELLATEPGMPGAERLHERLSNREFQIMRMIAAGRTVGQMSTDISLSTNTINTYRARVLEKMGMRSNAELIRYAVENHLID